MGKRIRGRRILLIAGGLLVAAYLAVGGYFYFRQDKFVFYPTRVPQAEMQARADALGFDPWRNAQGRQIGWQSRQGDPHNVLLVFNGQGSNAFSCAFVRELCAQNPSNWKTYLMEYPGYANRDGTCSEQSFTAAGVEAVDTLAADPSRTIWLLGQSLGSGVACATARECGRRIAGLLLLTPFNSLVETAAGYYPWLPVSPILRTRFQSDKNLAGYPGPVAIFVSGQDTTIPPAQGRKLFDSYPGRKRFWLDPASDHDVSGLLRREWPDIVSWLQAQRVTR